MRKLVLSDTLLVAWGESSVALHVYGQAKAMASNKAEIAALEKRYNDAFNPKDVNAIMACHAPANSLFVFDAVPPREYPSWEAYKKDWEALFAAFRARFPTLFRNRASP